MKQQIALSAGFTLVGFFAGLLVSILTARLLGPEGRGVYAAVFLWASAIANIATMGVADAAAVRATRRAETGGRLVLLMRRTLKTQITVTCIVAPAAIILFYIGLSVSGIDVDHLQIFACCSAIISAACGAVFQAYQRAAGQHLLYNVSRVFFFFMLLALLLSLYQLYSSPHTLNGVLSAFIIAHVLSLVFGAMIARRLLRGCRNTGLLDPALLRAGWSMHVPVIVNIISLNLDRFSAAALLEADVLGQYSVAASVAQPPAYLFVIALRTIMITDARLQDRYTASAHLLRYGSLTVLGTAAATLIAAATVALTLVPVFGKPFSPALPLAFWLLLGYLLSPLRAICCEFNRITGAPGLNVVVELLYIITFALSLLILPHFPHHGEYGLSLLLANIISLMLGVLLTKFYGSSARRA